MINDFLEWTRANEYSIETPFEWKKTDSGSFYVHDTGVVEFIPNKKTEQQFIFSCAIHGNETAPIEILNGIINDLISGKETIVHNTLFIFGNPKAINIEKRFSIENLNRLFAGALDNKPKNYETDRAKVLIDLVEKFYRKDTNKTHYDLHTAIRDSKVQKFAIYPYTPNRIVDKEQIAVLKDMGVSAVVLGNSPATTFSYHSAGLYGATSFTIELGKVKKFGENDPKDFEATRETLRKIINTTYVFREDTENVDIFSIKDEIMKKSEDFDFPFDDKIPNFTQFKKGETIYIENGKQINSSSDNTFMIFPNKKVKLNERAILLIESNNLP